MQKEYHEHVIPFSNYRLLIPPMAAVFLLMDTARGVSLFVFIVFDVPRNRKLKKATTILYLCAFRGIPRFSKHIIHPSKSFVNIVELHEIKFLYLPIIIVEFHKIIGRIRL